MGMRVSTDRLFVPVFWRGVRQSSGGNIREIRRRCRDDTRGDENARPSASPSIFCSWGLTIDSIFSWALEDWNVPSFAWSYTRRRVMVASNRRRVDDHPLFIPFPEGGGKTEKNSPGHHTLLCSRALASLRATLARKSSCTLKSRSKIASNAAVVRCLSSLSLLHVDRSILLRRDRIIFDPEVTFMSRCLYRLHVLGFNYEFASLFMDISKKMCIFYIVFESRRIVSVSKKSLLLHRNV